MTLKRTSNNNYSDFTYTSEVKKLLDVTLNTRDTNKLKKIYSNFYELETSSPAMALKAGESGTHIQLTCHFEGSVDALNPIIKKVLNPTTNPIK